MSFATELTRAAAQRGKLDALYRELSDDWTLIPPPGALGAGALAGAGLVALLTLGLASWLSVRPLVRRISGSTR